MRWFTSAALKIPESLEKMNQQEEKVRKEGASMFPNWRDIKITTYLLFILTLAVLASVVIEYKEFL
jgi:hypothetical protein